MRSPFRLTSRVWLLIPLCALGFLVWTNWERARRVDAVTMTDAEDAVVDAASATGYAGGKRWLIVPEHNNRSYQWIAETQQMLAQRQWRVRHVATENAPAGRPVYSASPYRWWLGLLAWADHEIFERPLGLSVERAALWADPLLHLLLVLFTTLFVARQFGAFSAALISIGLVTLYPLAGSFLPGAPEDHALARIFAVWSVLPLLAAFRGVGGWATTGPDATSTAGNQGRRKANRLFLIAGISGGLGLWINAATQVPVLFGIALGAFFSAWIAGRKSKHVIAAPPVTPPWRMWSVSGGATCLVAYLAEFYPAHLDFRLEVNHPLYGLAWIGMGQLMTLAWGWSAQGNKYWKLPRVIPLVLALAAVAALPAAMVRSGTRTFLAGDLSSSRLTSLPNGVVAKNFFAWLTSDGITAPLAATCLPLLLLVPALWLLFRPRTDLQQRAAIAVVLGPVIVVVALATYHLAWWTAADAMLLTLAVAAAAATYPAVRSPRDRWLWSGLAVAICLPGMLQLWPPSVSKDMAFTRLEVEGLVERGLAHWIADHADPAGAVVFAPPYRTTSLCFHGGLHGLGTANWENREGLEATVRIAAATTVDEAQGLIAQAGVTHLILPSWDSDLDAFAAWRMSNPEDAFIMALHHWALPPWLQALPYRLPSVPGFENHSVVILKVTEDSSRAVALARLAEYFVEMNQLEHATAAIPSLERYPSDLGALVALAKIAKARGDADAFGKAFKPLLTSLGAGFDRTLPWDRRVSLAVVLALGARSDLARVQVQRCIAQLDEARIRSLTTASLHHLLELSKAFDLPISDPRQHDLAVRLLPPELRGRLQTKS